MNDTLHEWTLEQFPGYRFRITQDYDYSINDYDADGKVSEYFEYRDLAGKQRPEGFDGAAMKISADRSGFVWWQPPKDLGIERDTDEWTEYVRYISNLVESGFCILWVEKLGDVDAYGNAVVEDYEVLGAMEPPANYDPGTDSYYTGIITEMVTEIEGPPHCQGHR
jgi:hypothetical protein